MLVKRTTTIAIATVLAVSISAAPGSAQEWRRDPTGWADGPIRHTLNLPVGGAGAIGGTLHESFLYVTTFTSFAIYDVSNPALPVLQSVTQLGPTLINEGPVTNGEILLISNDATQNPLRQELQIWDVTNKRLPLPVSSITLPTPEHIWACVDDCAYAYGAGGAIVDLRDPSAPRFVRDWREIAPIRVRHGMGTGAPGIVFTGSLPQYVFNASAPEEPEVLATIEPPTTFFEGNLGSGESLVSYVDWPDGGRDRVALTTLETPFSGGCNENSGGFVTYDTQAFENRGTFQIADVFRITETGTPDQGLQPDNAVGCSALGVDSHPGFRRGGAVAVGWAENGVRLFGVDKRGGINEAGGFIADGAEAFMPIWASEEVLYVVDTARGLDVFEVDVAGLG
ncbi:MAG: hypothetical protein ACRDIZ_02255 [Actinomycetota bacterium]